MKKLKKKRLIERPKDAYKKDSKVVRLSPEVDKAIKDLGHRCEPYDNILRRLLGMAANKYHNEISKELWTVSDLLFEDEAEARGEAIKLAVKLKKKPSPVTKVRSLI